MSSARLALLPSLAALVIAMLSLQVGASIAKQLFSVIGVEATVTLRLLVSAVLLTVVFKPWHARFTNSNWLAVTMYGASLACMNLSFYFALQTIPLGIAVALEFVGPMAVAMIWSRRLVDFVWVVVAIVGLLLLLPFSDASKDLDPTGVMLALVAGGCWAIYIVVGQKAGRDHGGLAAVLGVIIAAIIVTPVGLSCAGASLFGIALLPTAVAIGSLSSAGPYTVEMYALRRLPTPTFGSL
ncbi:MAG: EamA family transporter, partial [Rhizobiaceae bacterium]